MGYQVAVRRRYVASFDTSYFNGTVWNTDGSQADVAAKAALAQNRDQILIPAGTFDWSSGVTINKAVWLRAAGIGSTIIRDNITTNTQLISWNLVADLFHRQSGIEFQSTGSAASKSNGIMQVQASAYDGRRFRMDHCKFDQMNGTYCFTYDVLGVIDNCTFVDTRTSQTNIFVYVYHSNWGNVPFSDGSWAQAVNWGTDEFLFIEDCICDRQNAAYAITDAYRGARYVVRNCEIYNSWVEMHGTDSAQRFRGTRATEVYNNTFGVKNGVANSYVVNVRSGTTYVHDNVVTGYSIPHIQLSAYRITDAFQPFGTADGTSPWDINDGTNPQYTGTCTSAGTRTMTDSTKSFPTPNGLVGSSIKKVPPTVDPQHDQQGSLILSNTATQVTFQAHNEVGHSDMAFAPGDGYSINIVQQILDQACVGGGTQLVPKGITGLSSSGTTVTVTVPSHGYSTGDWVAIGSTEPTTYTGTYQITLDGADPTNKFTYQSFNSNLGPASNFGGAFPYGSCTKVSPLPYTQNVEASHAWSSPGCSFVVDDGMSSQIVSGTHYKTTAPAGYTPYTHPHPLTLVT